MARIRGRFAPSPSGRMHLGNLFSALLAWLDVRSLGGELLLRLEDLDPDRCRADHAVRLADDLRWLGLDWDLGWQPDGSAEDYRQSARTAFYADCFAHLGDLVYPCYCTRRELLAASAPHPGDGARVYDGRCRALTPEQRRAYEQAGRRPAWRVRVPAEVVAFTDGSYGPQREDLATDCGDFIVRRSDGVYAYQLAVAADDGAMGIDRVVRGRDLLSSTPRQLWLMDRLGYRRPAYCHVPLLCAPDGRRLAKRDRDLDMGALRARHGPEEVVGRLAWLAGLRERPDPVRPEALAASFSWDRVGTEDRVVVWDG